MSAASRALLRAARLHPCLTLSTGIALPILAAAAQAQPVVSPDLPPVTVTAPAIPRDQVGPVEGYRALTSTAGTRTATPIREVPQSIQVLPRQLLEEQGSTGVSDALRNVTSVIPQHPLHFNGDSAVRVRGFEAEVLRDGLSSFFEPGLRDSLLGVERVEVLKGPTGALFGGGYGGSAGGTINLVSSRPQRENSYAAGVRLGPYGFRSTWFDVNQRAGAIAADGTEVMVRVQGEHLNSRSYTDNVREDGFQLRPSFTVRNDRTSLTVQAFLSERNVTDYSGLPMQGTVLASGFTAPRFGNPNNGGAPRTTTDQIGVAALLEHRIDDTWTARLQGRFSSGNLEQPTQFLFGAPVAGSTFVRFNGYLWQDLTQATLVPSIEGRFTTGNARHTVLAGMELDSISDGGGFGFAPADFYDVLAPTTTPFIRPGFAGLLTDNRYTTVAGFVQDQVTLWDRLHLLGGVRLAQISIDSRNPDTQAGFTSTTTRVLPRLGISYDVTEALTVFTGWGRAIRTNPYTSLTTGIPKPEETEQVEAGVKLDLPFGLTGTASVFEIRKQNVAVADPASPFTSIQTGEQRFRGVEFDLVWQPDPRFSVLGSVTHVSAKVTEDTTLEGNRLPWVPRNTARAWAAYRLLDAPAPWMRGLTIGAGVTSASGSPVEATNAAYTRGYTTIDAQISYEAGPLRVALTGRNLNDARYFVPYQYLSGAVATGAPREVYLSAALRF